ncbi:MAG: hypothetical protein EOM15_15380 [Spirochaetia bacterium]|nr:hypothetical protein [Spirochaetia bacterium]
MRKSSVIEIIAVVVVAVVAIGVSIFIGMRLATNRQATILPVPAPNESTVFATISAELDGDVSERKGSELAEAINEEGEDPPTLVSEPTISISPTLTPRGLGLSREVLQAPFERPPFNVVFVEAFSSTEEPEVTGLWGNGITITFAGSDTNVTQAQVQIKLGDGLATSEEALLAMITLLEVAVPDIGNASVWLKPHLEKALETNYATVVQQDRDISIIAVSEIKFIVLTIGPGITSR